MKKRINAYGYIPEYKMWLFENCAVVNGKVYEKNAEEYIETPHFKIKTGDMTFYSLAEKPTMNTMAITDEEERNIIKNWLSVMNDKGTFNGLLVLGYIYSIAYQPELSGEFPFLYIIGEAGTGKTEVMKLLMHFFGFEQADDSIPEKNLREINKFAKSLKNYPYFLDDLDPFAPMKKIRKFSNIHYEKNMPKLIFAGQYPMVKAFLSRSIIIDKELPTSEATEAYYFLKREKGKFSAIFLQIIKEKDEEKKKKIIHYQNMVYDYVKKHLKELGQDTFVDERIILNYCKIAAGWFMWKYQNDSNSEKSFLVWLTKKIINQALRQER